MANKSVVRLGDSSWSDLASSCWQFVIQSKRADVRGVDAALTLFDFSRIRPQSLDVFKCEPTGHISASMLSPFASACGLDLLVA